MFFKNSTTSLQLEKLIKTYKKIKVCMRIKQWGYNLHVHKYSFNINKPARQIQKILTCDCINIKTYLKYTYTISPNKEAITNLSISHKITENQIYRPRTLTQITHSYIADRQNTKFVHCRACAIHYQTDNQWLVSGKYE